MDADTEVNMDGYEPTMRDIAAFLGVSLGTVYYRRTKGMPTHSLEAACRWWVKQPLSRPYHRSAVVYGNAKRYIRSLNQQSQG